MNDDRIGRVLPLLFKQAKIPQRAKEELRQRLFILKELTDEELSLVAAAGEIKEQAAQQKNLNNGGNDHDTSRKI